MVYLISKFIFFLVSKIFFRMQVHGVENIPKKGAFILASNHISNLDPVTVGSACPRRLNYMAKEELFLNPILSLWMNAVGCFPVKRDSADISALREAIRRLKSGGGLFLFPEGTRQEPGVKSAQPQAGIGFLAAKHSVPVVPAFVKGTDQAMPKGAKFIKPARVSVFFGKQIHIGRGVPYQDASSLIMEKIRRLAS